MNKQKGAAVQGILQRRSSDSTSHASSFVNHAQRVDFRYFTVMLSALCILALVTKTAFADVGRAAYSKVTMVSANPPAMPSFAFYYGPHVPVPELSAFDAVVVEPDSDFDPKVNNTPHTEWFAYTSVGEVNPGRPYWRNIPRAWLLGDNKAWDSSIIDLSVPQWRDFYLDYVIAPLWEKGFRNFFLDTLDSYRTVARAPGEQARQEAGAVGLIRAIKQRYPSARLILNRGFELLPSVHELVYAVTFESLYRGWNQSEKRYFEIPTADRDWLISQVGKAKAYGLPVVAIDYCPPEDGECVRDTVAKVRELGVIPYVTVPLLDRIGVGTIKVEPRRILVVQDIAPQADFAASDGVRYLEMLVNYLGYRADYIDATQALPQHPLNDVYAGLVLWMNGAYPNPRALHTWLGEQIDAGMRVAVIGDFGMPIGRTMADRLDLHLVTETPQGPLAIEFSDPALMGFEIAPQPDPHNYVAIRVGPSGKSLLRLKAGNFAIDAAAITRWGGYVMRPFAISESPQTASARWVIQPLAFLQQALELPRMPVPDTTTEAGRRLFMTQIYGDGFGARTDFGGARKDTYASEVLLNIVRKYGWPTTVSITGTQLQADGSDPASAPVLRSIARQMFALPNVEMALEVAGDANTQPSPQSDLPLPIETKGKGARASTAKAQVLASDRGAEIEHDISDSIARIGSELAPPGKFVKMLFWSGSTAVPSAVAKAAYDAHVLPMQSGDTVITKRNPSWTAISPIAVKQDGYFHIFAPNQSEVRYTNYWQGPFYGFERVLETFEMTDRPIRFKPVDVHLHMYTGTRHASVTALERIYRSVSTQSLNPVFTSEYALKALDFFGFSIARDGDTWIVRDAGQLRTVRLEAGDAPDLTTSRGIAGYISGPSGVYVHMTDSEARFNVLHGAAREKNSSIPYIADANGRIEGFARKAGGFSFDLHSHVIPAFRLVNARHCRVMADGRTLTPNRPTPGAPAAVSDGEADVVQLRVSSYALGQSRTLYQGPGRTIHVDVDCGI